LNNRDEVLPWVSKWSDSSQSAQKFQVDPFELSEEISFLVSVFGLFTINRSLSGRLDDLQMEDYIGEVEGSERFFTHAYPM
jgi:hypothetical protein